MMGTVVTAPPADRAFDSSTTDGSEENSEGDGGRVGFVGPKTMVASGDTKASPEVVDDSPESSLPLERRPEGSDAAHKRDTENQEAVKPIDMLVPVCLCDWSVGDVWLFGIVLWVSVWLRCARLGGGLRDILRVDGHFASSGLMGRHFRGREAVREREEGVEDNEGLQSRAQCSLD